jgi:hypothetical protein
MTEQWCMALRGLLASAIALAMQSSQRKVQTSFKTKTELALMPTNSTLCMVLQTLSSQLLSAVNFA